jgi:methyl-accepting chemotaxis protein
LADDLEASVMNVVTALSSSATEMQGTAQSLSSLAQQASSKATAVAAASEETTSNVGRVATAAKELSSSIGRIGDQVSEAARISAIASEQTATTNKRVQDLSTAADKIGEVVKLINDIASQTNLLALNATIEAARAGDAGKGFAVVAGEVKNLANQTGRATEEISGQISTVQEETRHAVEAIKNIGSVIDKVREISSGIMAAVAEQTAATTDIARNVSEAAEGTREVASNIGDVTQAAVNTGTSATQMLASASGVSQHADQLRQAVVRFLGNIRAS